MAATSTDIAALLATDAAAQPFIQELFQQASNTKKEAKTATTTEDARKAFSVGINALNLFLQINVTGPVPSRQPMAAIESQFLKAWESSVQPEGPSNSSVTPLVRMRRDCVRQLETDGVSPYAHVPSLELFCLARHIFTQTLSAPAEDTIQLAESDSQKHSISWTRMRVHVWHYKLIAQPSLGGSTFTKSSNWIELPSLATQISDSMDAVRGRVLSDDVWSDEGSWSTQDKVQFLLEAANNNILLGRSEMAKTLVEEATKENNFLYALSGALGKRTKFQEKNISQLVVLAVSQTEEAAKLITGDDEEEDAKPQALQLNDDTLLEEIQFAKEKNSADDKPSELPEQLAKLTPDEQPQLNPLDQITLLTEATLKDTFSPADSLTAEEILPFATRVIADKSTNWQTYTQALLVRSRIEVHRSRTVERGVLQMQAVADQVLTDTTFSAEQVGEPAKEETTAPEVPSIQVSAPGHHTGDEAAPATTAPTTFFPAPKASESAPADVRLRYIHALSTPPRWHLEAELAYAWAGVGSLVSALEIFKRLRLWAEVALCLASADAVDDEDGRGSGGDAKAKGIVRWQLFNKTGADASSTSDPDDEVAPEAITSLKGADFMGPERALAPSNAPRLWCILGELENDAAHYERAWEVSNHRYARAQRSLAELYLREKDLDKAHEAYKKATAVNRLDPDMWCRLGDISLRLGRFADAAEAFNRAISSSNGEQGGEDAKTWSNLGTALFSLYREALAAQKEAANAAPAEAEAAATTTAPATAEDEEDDVTNAPAESSKTSKDPEILLRQALNAYHKGATASHDNWRIWENVVTLACRMRPPAVAEVIAATRQILRIRKTEDAVNTSVVGALLQEEVLSKARDDAPGIYEPPRGSLERLVTRLFEEDILPLITHRAELWSLVSKLRGWRRDYAGAIDAAEKAWRAAYGASGSGLLPGDSTAAGADWTEDEAGFLEVVSRTDELVSVLENWGEGVEDIGAKWRGKARSAVRSVMGRGKTNWEGTEGWTLLEALMEGLKVNK